MFTIDRNGGGTLCDQIAEGFRRAIAAGEYGPGDRLPQMRELAADLSNEIVPNHMGGVYGVLRLIGE